MKKLPLLFILLFGLNCFSQFSKTHYIPPLTSNPGVAPQDHYIYISTPSVQVVKFKILLIGGVTISATVSKTAPFIYPIGSGENTQLFEPSASTGKITNKGFVIESEGLIYANIRTNAGNAAQAGGIVAKGISGLGKRFRAGAMLNSSSISGLLNFFSVLATENNTKITLSNIPNGTVLANGSAFTGPEVINLNKNESYIVAINGSEGSKLIGALIESDKNVVVNSGSIGGTNDPSNVNGRDLGFDQIVGADKIGTDYIFIKGLGSIVTERVLLVADEDDTVIYLNGSTTPFQTIQAGTFLILDGNDFVNSTLYIKTSKKIFAYQSIGGTASSANQNLSFVPPLNCSTPKIVDNIPVIDRIGNTVYTGVVNIVTENGATVLINDAAIGVPPTAIAGTTAFVYYSVNGLANNIAIKSTKQVYVSYYATNNFATYGGYYSGFDLKPELSIDNSTVVSGSCIPNLTLKTEPDVDYTYQWIKNDADLLGQNGNTYTPSEPGYYQVKRSIPSCSTSSLSDKIPVSNCPTDTDTDTVADDIDLDYDNDGITNCEESYGNAVVDLTATSLVKNNYSNTYSSNLITRSPNNSAVSAPFIGKPNGDFISELPAGKGNILEYTLNFTNPIALTLDYVATGSATDLLNADGEFSVKSAIDKTITVLNPTNQLLIDTNYDGIYESGVSQHSSFEIRFRLNSTTPLAAGTGTFSFQSYQTSSLTFVHKNLSDTANNKASFTIKAKCIPRDSDSDAVADYLDTDSDNDGILDVTESQPNTVVGSSAIDLNKDGILDVFGSGTLPQDTDLDTVNDYIDDDSDNDGILDNVETQADQDNDGIRNYRDLDLEDDGCKDVVEAGFNDGDSDGKFGNAPISVGTNGRVVGASYSAPNANYTIAAPILISVQPQATPSCELENTSVSIADNGGNSYQWQLSTDNTNWLNLTNTTTYTGVTTTTLSINQVQNAMNGYRYRVVLSKPGNGCGLISNATSLTVYALPTVLSSIDLKQCDTDSDGIADFNLTEKNNVISSTSGLEQFYYYTSLAGATAKDAAVLIPNPTAYRSNTKSIWVRIENSNLCFRTARMDLIVSSTQIPATFKKQFENCDDTVNTVSTDIDGISEFDFSSTTSAIENLLIPPLSQYTIQYYRNEADALAENNPITNPTKYRNIGYPNEQDIWVRVESVLDNSCFGLGPHIKLIVNPKPTIDTNADGLDDQLVCSNLPTFFATLDAGIGSGVPSTTFNYDWTKDGASLPVATNSVLNVNAEGLYSVTVRTSKGCFRTRTIKVTASDVATITSIEIKDLAERNSVAIFASGKGKYEYSLDLPTGPFQVAPVFDNVAAGIHDVYVIDKNGCGTISKQIAVIGLPQFFTPNGDSFNDFWNVKGVNPLFNSKSIIFIYDRYGKLLKQILPSSPGWDGTFNGAPLPADDYWFSVQLEDGREAKGHFSLKR